MKLGRRSFSARTILENLKQIARSLLTIYIVSFDGAVQLLGHSWRTRNLIRETVLGNDSRVRSGSAAVYVNYDPDGIVHDYVVYQLRELADAGFWIIFVTNSPTFADASRDRVAPFCKKIIWRFNRGYDFGAYKDGLAAIPDLHRIDQLLLMNDSTYGPFQKLSTILASIDKTKVDFWGIADSWEHEYHIQSFFIIFFQKAIRSSAFKLFWRDLPFIDNKAWIIRNGEIKLTQALSRAHLRGGVLAPYWSAAEKMKDRIALMENSGGENYLGLEEFESLLWTNHPLNPMHHLWEVMIVDFKCPFLKRELIKSNPANPAFSFQWAKVIASQGDYDISMINRHLAREIR
jgi:lipopolysaccharide biosynthesis protein